MKASSLLLSPIRSIDAGAVRVFMKCVMCAGTQTVFREGRCATHERVEKGSIKKDRSIYSLS